MRLLFLQNIQLAQRAGRARCVPVRSLGARASADQMAADTRQGAGLAGLARVHILLALFAACA